jgi:hypothetical protein
MSRLEQCSFCFGKSQERVVGQTHSICRKCLGDAKETVDLILQGNPSPHEKPQFPSKFHCFLCGRGENDSSIHNLLAGGSREESVFICTACVISLTASPSFKVLLGTDTLTSQEIYIDDTARRSGVYVLGKSGFGKSVLLSSMAIQDATNGHGLFFLDPHGDAIRGMTPKLPNPPIVLDVEERTHSFGINLLACRDPSDIVERSHTYTRAYNAFKKIFQDEKGEWGPWLQLIIQYSLYVFIENQGYTLAELPLFLTDRAFRAHLLRNVKHHTEAVVFWRQEFDPIQAQAALTRVRSLLGDMYVSHIIGQETTIDLAAIMEEGGLLCSSFPQISRRMSKSLSG